MPSFRRFTSSASPVASTLAISTVRAATSTFAIFALASGSTIAGAFASGVASFSDFRLTVLSATCASSGVLPQSAFALTVAPSVPSSTRARVASPRYGCRAGNASASTVSFVSACFAATLNAPSAFTSPPCDSDVDSVYFAGVLPCSVKPSSVAASFVSDIAVGVAGTRSSTLIVPPSIAK
ncbi:hypothetical protein BamIOP4010DRAFT_5842 [Burkholderia ambifaria IOP40-10]|uniref:Secreted protein n=1 Tax=Burkholderia ambifaria IOP40-10 TaxID=396596 RepID=B1FP81_9BURK|nr:hypothetical protein BamIOP4010DRAFT_5842 [Burkholderia ambifaria IOP40-10]